MKKIRIGKDIIIRWAILTNGESESLQGRDLRLVILDPLRRKTTVTEYETEGHIISFRYTGVQQKILGKYSFTLWENFGKLDMTAVDACNVFELVSTTCQEPTSDMENETVEWQSNIQIGIKGASAYEIAVENGFAGTEEEWLASLKGEKGDAFTYEDFTPTQIAELQKPAINAAQTANDAAENATQAATQATQATQSADTATRNAAIAAENANAAGQSIAELEQTIEQAERVRISAEQSRSSAETSRRQSEESRVSAEQSRSIAETTREQQEQNRQSAEQQRVKDFNELKQESETATNNANQAAQSANTAAENANQAAATVNSRLSEVYTNYAAIEASGETDTNKIYIDGETLISYVYKNGKFVQTSGKPKGGYNRALFESTGAKFNEESGFYELDELKDLTEADMIEVYKVYNVLQTTFYSNNICMINKKIRIVAGFVNKASFSTTNFTSAFSDASNLEIIYEPSNFGYGCSVGYYSFNSCIKLRKVKGLRCGTTNDLVINNCPQLEEIYIFIGDIKKSINLSYKDSPKINLKSLTMTVNSSKGEHQVTITVHPTTYSYLTGTAEPTEQVGGTTEEWQVLVTTALEKQITFVSA